MNQHWENTILRNSDYYKKVLMDGCIIKKGDVEIYDLRCFYKRKFDQSRKLRIHVYKANRNKKEILEEFHNYNDAFLRFESLVKQR